MGHPPIGMHYRDALKTARRFKELKAKNKPLQKNVIKSVINQARLHEGEKGAKELVKELNSSKKGYWGFSDLNEKTWEEIFKKEPKKEKN